MATRIDREGARLVRDNLNAKATGLGHKLVWRTAPNANRRGHAYYWIGECADCGGMISAGPAWSRTAGPTDPRHEHCPGVERQFFMTLFARAFGRYSIVSRFDQTDPRLRHQPAIAFDPVTDALKLELGERVVRSFRSPHTPTVTHTQRSTR